MNPQDRQLLDALNRRQQNLETAMAVLKTDLQQFAARLDLTSATAPITAPPPLPNPPPETPTPLPPLPESNAPVEPGPGFEVQFGRWLARIGVVFALLTLIFFSVVAYKDFYRDFGPWSKLGILALVSGGLFAAGLWLERRSADLLVYGRTLAGGGLACLYYTLYGATYVHQLQVIDSPLVGGFLLLAWSAVVLVLAERRKSELLSIFAISLAYFSSAITPVGGFTMVADLILAVTAVVFLIRNAWTGLSYLCLIGTYLGFVRQIILSGPDVTGDIIFAHGPVFFWPWTIYLTGAWLIFTAGIFLARTASFEGGKRMAFLCLNNGAWIGLLFIAAELSGFHHVGDLLLVTGVVMLGLCALARWRLPEARDIVGAYLAQGLALATAGLVVLYHGVTRGLILTAESVGLVAAGTYSRQPVLRFGGGGVALLGAAFLLVETLDKSPFPWWLMAAGVAAMVANTWLARASLLRVLYIALGLVLGVRWIYGVVPAHEITLTLFALATALVGGGALGRGTSMIRAGLILDLVGGCNYLSTSTVPVAPSFTWLDATAFALFLAQPALLRHWGRELISDVEGWLAVLASSALAWLFLSNSIAANDDHNLTLGWALLALGLIVIGFAANERRQRWCGLGILAAAFVRVAVHDFWGFSDAGKVITYFALTVICLGLSFLYYKFADRLKEWL